MAKRVRPTHTVDVERRSKTGTTRNEPRYSTTNPETGLAVHFDESSTSFERIDGGERVQEPATAIVRGDKDVQEGDTLTNWSPSLGTDFEVVGVDRERDRSATVVSMELELEVA